ncbi:seminal vesicle secretory protein 6-like [Arvicola amphibius]|uniref:seminal vesicle secretory protein 6-like n=1 Tax=Arvicola amphibius TaxID=1047088 RepID=UPI0018E355B5|nr:seminal vesicle secretory protein 6-like [Arvicola amphibius]
MNLTSFFLLTLLLALVTEASARRPREKFSQASEENSSESSEAKNPKSSVSEEGSWSSFKSKSAKSSVGEEGSDGDRASESAGEMERSYTRRKEKQRFGQEVAK